MNNQVCIHCGKKKQHDKNAGCKICQCCDKLRATVLVPASTNTNTSSLDTLLNELCDQIKSANTPEERSFVQIKEQFLEDNYPDLLKGMKCHPDVFIGKQKKHGFPEPHEETSEDKGNISEREVYDFLTEEFKNDDCIIFHSYKSGIDSKVVTKFCEKLNENLVTSKNTVKEVEEKIKVIADLALLDFKAINDEAIKDTPAGADLISVCKKKITIFKTHLNRRSQEKDFFVVSLSLSAILHFEVKSNPNQNLCRQ